MQAVILAGGLGKRLRTVTGMVPKVMVPVNGRPFIAYLLELLSSNGIGEVVMCTGYQGEQVKEYLGEGRSFGVNIVYSEEKESLLGTGGAVKQAQALLHERFFIINGDTYLPVDYSEVEGSFIGKGKGALMVVYDSEGDNRVKCNVELGGHSMVAGYDKEGFTPGLKYVDAGVMALRREALDLIEGGCPVSLEKELYPLLIGKGELAAYITGVKFYDIGTPEQVKVFEEYLKGLSG